MPRLRRSHPADWPPPCGAVPCLWGEEQIEVKGVKPSPLPSTLPTDLLFCFPFRLGCGILFLIYFLILPHYTRIYGRCQ